MGDNEEAVELSSKLEDKIERMEGVVLDMRTSMEKVANNMEGLTSGIKVLIDRLDVNRKSTGVTITESEAVETTENVSSGIVEVKKLARHAQGEQLEFEVGNVYNTLVDPNPRTQEELTMFGNAAIKAYESEREPDIREQFEDDFYFWEEEHFKLLPKSSAKHLRDLLVKAGGSVDKKSWYSHLQGISLLHGICS